MSQLKFRIKGSCASLEVFFENGVKLGEMLVNDDGFYVYFPELNGGYWDAHMLSLIAQTLDKLNEPWAKRLAQETLWRDDEAPPILWNHDPTAAINPGA